jgi:hypothetical protein
MAITHYDIMKYQTLTSIINYNAGVPGRSLGFDYSEE